MKKTKEITIEEIEEVYKRCGMNDIDKIEDKWFIAETYFSYTSNKDIVETAKELKSKFLF